MKRLHAWIVLFLISLCSPSLMGQSVSVERSMNDNEDDAKKQLLGAWETYPDAGDREIKIVVILADGYYSGAVYDLTDNNKFLSTLGGTWSAEGDEYSSEVEYNSQNPAEVGTKNTSKFEIKDNTLKFSDEPFYWKRIDDGTPGDLAGAWLITGRERDGEMVTRSSIGARKTMKILSGTRFQWIAYNVETKEFMGTGGGTYTSEKGQYIEKIEFFSRDNERVGDELPFKFELKDGNWHHKGKSSKGKDLYEIWSRRHEVEEKGMEKE